MLLLFASCRSNLTKGIGVENNHEYVDLGLSVKWATCNVGATRAEEYGDYFAWGETQAKSTYNWSTYKWSNDYITRSKYNTKMGYGTIDNKTQLDFSDDAARVNWGGNWRMPTDVEITELYEQCTWTEIALNGVKGYKVTSKINGNTLLFWNKYSGTGDYATSTIKSGGGLHSAYITYKPYVPYPRTDDELWNYDKYEVNFRPVVNSESNGSQGGGPGGNQGGGCTDCGSNCTGECKTGCSYNCAATCTNNCGGQCNTTCGGSCKYVNAGSSCSGCARTCDGRCYHTCDRACSNNCESTCVHQSR